MVCEKQRWIYQVGWVLGTYMGNLLEALGPVLVVAAICRVNQWMENLFVPPPLCNLDFQMNKWMLSWKLQCRIMEGHIGGWELSFWKEHQGTLSRESALWAKIRRQRMEMGSDMQRTARSGTCLAWSRNLACMKAGWKWNVFIYQAGLAGMGEANGTAVIPVA